MNSRRARPTALLASHSEEREDLFTRLTVDEQRAFAYQCYRVPTIGRAGSRCSPRGCGPRPLDDPCRSRS